MDAKITSVVELVVDAKVPHRVLTESTEAGLAAARAAAGPSVDATGSLGSARGDTRSVRIALTMRAPPAAALKAEAGFATAFLARIEAQGWTGRRA